MTEERIFALLRAAERLGIEALTWIPYSDECPEWAQSKRSAADRQINKDLSLIRSALDEQQNALLNIAEHKGSHA